MNASDLPDVSFFFLSIETINDGEILDREGTRPSIYARLAGPFKWECPLGETPLRSKLLFGAFERQGFQIFTSPPPTCCPWFWKIAIATVLKLPFLL